ncbi:thioredoxin domain-containing protein [Nonomuraea phyllanthi]|uniref:Thioredoxin domain-containing protein n=1 Tax=Nonomuraea phyllanthi TaxID=2219224 RepID=A0A5C4WF88_9ACTN|nr:thioredoxin domain-containing protein [Nonomuraea phyllanthi]KAB8193661.1 thioredoxin domain-containing protein [Nonomuraea phyllanthi]QFY12402.1 thioredoxin domain-containing protein [Nonomuraea phyllanthi]
MMKRLLAVALACAAIVVLGVLAFSEPSESSGGVRLARQVDGSMVLADRSSHAPVLDLYEDFDCPVCKELHSRVDATIRKLAMEGLVKVVYHPVTIFKDEPMRSNSIRAAAAARCVPEENWLAFRDELYAMQPAPHGQASGFDVEDLVKAARQAGASVDQCVRSQSYAEAHLAETAKIRLQGTPTVLLDGRMLGNEAFDATLLERAITGGDGVAV